MYQFVFKFRFVSVSKTYNEKICHGLLSNIFIKIGSISLDPIKIF